MRTFGDEVTKDALDHMPILHSVLKEALRLKPPLIFLIRRVHKERQFKEYTIPVGDEVFLSPALSGSLEEVFEEANNFKYDRFIGDFEKNMEKYTWFGFG